MQCQHHQGILQFWQMQGIWELCPHLPHCGLYDIRCRWQNTVSCVSEGRPQPTMPKVHAIDRVPYDQRHVARGCRTATLPHSLEGHQHRKGETPARGTHPTSRAHEIEGGVYSVHRKGRLC